MSVLLAILLAGEPSPSAEAATEPPEPSALPEPPELPEPPVLPEPPSEPEAILWAAPAGCASAPELRRGIERRLGRTLAPGEAQVDGQVDPGAAGGYRLTLRTTAAGVIDERVLEADDCRALADATTLVVALAVDPVAVVETMGPWEGEPVEAPPVASTPTPAPARRETPAAEPERSRRPGGVVRVAAGVGLGALPGITAVPSLAGGLRWRRARLELEGAYWIPRTSAAIDGAKVRVQLGTTTVRGCGQLGRDRLEAPLCGGLQVGGMRGDGSGAPGSRKAQGLWLALEAGVGLSWWFRPRWALAGGFTAAVPLVKPGFELSGDPPLRLFEASSVVGRVWLGIELRL